MKSTNGFNHSEGSFKPGKDAVLLDDDNIRRVMTRNTATFINIDTHTSRK